jgi:hypothetical protein
MLLIMWLANASVFGPSLARRAHPWSDFVMILIIHFQQRSHIVLSLVSCIRSCRSIGDNPRSIVNMCRLLDHSRIHLNPFIDPIRSRCAFCSLCESSTRSPRFLWNAVTGIDAVSFEIGWIGKEYCVVLNIAVRPVVLCDCTLVRTVCASSMLSISQSTSQKSAK